MSDKGVKIIVTAAHVAGHKESTEFTAPVDKDAYMTEPQKWSSAATFAKRNAFCNAFGILTGDEDTDANFQEKGKKAHINTDVIFEEAKKLIADSDTLENFYKRTSTKEFLNKSKDVNDKQRIELRKLYKEKEVELQQNESA